jgi:hypothetical protein
MEARGGRASIRKTYKKQSKTNDFMKRRLPVKSDGGSRRPGLHPENIQKPIKNKRFYETEAPG